MRLPRKRVRFRHTPVGGAANAFAQNPTGGWAAVSQELKESVE